MVSALEQRLAPSITRAIAVELDSRGAHGKRRAGGATDAAGLHPKRRASQCHAEGEPMRSSRSHGPLAAGDLQPVAPAPNAPQLIPHNAKRRGSSRHILPEQLSDRPLECVADWSHEQSMAC